ncbi:Translation initiation factor IF-2, partial [Dissostichus eleginoides]
MNISQVIKEQHKEEVRSPWWDGALQDWLSVQDPQETITTTTLSAPHPLLLHAQQPPRPPQAAIPLRDGETPSPPCCSPSSSNEPPVEQKAEQSCGQAPPPPPLVPLVSMILKRQMETKQSWSRLPAIVTLIIALSQMAGPANVSHPLGTPASPQALSDRGAIYLSASTSTPSLPNPSFRQGPRAPMENAHSHAALRSITMMAEMISRGRPHSDCPLRRLLNQQKELLPLPHPDPGPSPLCVSRYRPHTHIAETRVSDCLDLRGPLSSPRGLTRRASGFNMFTFSRHFCFLLNEVWMH